MTIDHQYLTATLDGLLSMYAQDLEQLHNPEKIRRLDGTRKIWNGQRTSRDSLSPTKSNKLDVCSEQNKFLALWGLRRKHARHSRINGTAK